jgi:redox-sensitive bicupin YhaK (pirin superfamily)
MEIISIVLDGQLAHRDSAGNEGVIRPGEAQWMSAGSGVEHSEYNGSSDEPVHFLQIWIQPNQLNSRPGYDQRDFSEALALGKWVTVASDHGHDGGMAMRADATLRMAKLDAGGAELGADLDTERRYWLHLAQGELEIQFNGTTTALQAGDAVSFEGEGGHLQLIGHGLVLLFTLK